MVSDAQFRVAGYVAAGVAATAGAVSETTQHTDPAVSNGGYFIGLAAVVTAIGTHLMPTLRYVFAQMQLKSQLDQARLEIKQILAHAAEVQARAIEIEARSVADRKRIVELEQVAQQIPVNTTMANNAEVKADAALSAIRTLRAEGYLASESDHQLAVAGPIPDQDERPRLLIVEDHQTTASAIMKLFEARGWLVDRAGCHDAAIDRVCGDYDWIMLDLILPGGGGEDVLARVREHCPGRKVAIVTAIEDESRLASLGSLRPDAVLRKPVGHALLFRTIVPVIDRRARS